MCNHCTVVTSCPVQASVSRASFNHLMQIKVNVGERVSGGDLGSSDAECHFIPTVVSSMVTPLPSTSVPTTAITQRSMVPTAVIKMSGKETFICHSIGTSLAVFFH